MSVIADRYRQLRPDLELLADEAVLGQSWKKADAHIRRHNWYADILELDCALIELPELLNEWSAAVANGDLRPEPMRLVPAPKNARWSFRSGAGLDARAWGFDCPERTEREEGEAKPKPGLRPLAHLSVRDQTLSTAVMLCLADAVETAQGNTDQPDYRTAQRQQVYSYGNRLHCAWTRMPDETWRARFRWGNANTYTKFFQDYQRFLDRPVAVCRDRISQLSLGHRLYVVNLDLSKFYDRIHRGRLIRRLKRLYEEYSGRYDAEYSDESAEGFWECAATIMRWSWNGLDNKQSCLFDSDQLPDGLPQGLVPGGFFANAYMIDLDRRIGGLIEEEVRQGIRLLDYCRYVDDIRLVVAANSKAVSTASLEDNLRSNLTAWMNQQLGSYCRGLRISKRLEVQDKKTEVIAWEDFAMQGGTSQYMRRVQSEISVVPDAQTLRQTTGNLEHLLSLAEALEAAPASTGNALDLSRISLPRADVRDDTIKRFAANRLVRVLRLRRSMVAPISNGLAEETDGPEDNELKALDHEMETIARKLVACWARNPALVAVLRCGLDLFPHPELLQPVLAALRLKLDADREHMPNESEVAQYVLAELLKAGAVETGTRDPEDYASRADIGAYRQELQRLAIHLLDADVLWFVRQQAATYLATQNHAVRVPDKPELSCHRRLHSILRYDRHVVTKGLLPIALVAQRIAPDSKSFALWFGAILKRVKTRRANVLCSQLGLIDPELLLAVVDAHPEEKSWKRWTARLLPPRARADTPKGLRGFGGGPIPIERLASHPQNPFVQENALLKLAVGLLQLLQNYPTLETLGLQSLQVQCKDWKAIQAPGSNLKVSLTADGHSIPQELGEIPVWCRPRMGWAFTLGRLLRSAIIGQEDYTSRFYPPREEVGPYQGIRSTWFKRRMGLAVVAQGLGEEPTPISPWLNELILRLLQWPGIEIDQDLVSGFSEVQEPADLLPIVRRRLDEQKRIYGRLSNLPVYQLSTDHSDGRGANSFRVAIVQSLLPRTSDFSTKDPTFWTPAFRRRHRAHLASVCRLIDQHLRTIESASDTAPSALSLVVFPELSVHPDDLQLLISLSDSTKAAIFAGQTFVKHPFLRKPVNRAIWILRHKPQSGRQIVTVYQGKQHMTQLEKKCGVIGHRPFQLLIEFRTASLQPVQLTGTICYDATDLRLAADMRDISDGLVVSSLNKDINTFDTMAEALQYHMFQPIVLANSGQYGGSSAQAPYKERHQRLIAHVHGNNQVAISVFELDLWAFKTRSQPASPLPRKAPPAGYKGRP